MSEIKEKEVRKSNIVYVLKDASKNKYKTYNRCRWIDLNEEM